MTRMCDRSRKGTGLDQTADADQTWLENRGPEEQIKPEQREAHPKSKHRVQKAEHRKTQRKE